MTIVLITITVGVPLYQLLFVHCCKTVLQVYSQHAQADGTGNTVLSDQQNYSNNHPCNYNDRRKILQTG